MEKDNSRFEVTHQESKVIHTRVITDKETGQEYLFVSDGNAGGLTPIIKQTK